MMPRRIIIAVLTAGAAVFGAIAIAQAASTSSTRPSNSTRPNVRSVKHVQRIHVQRIQLLHDGKAVLPHWYAVLRSASIASATAFPPATAEHLTESGAMTSKYELEPTKARYVDAGDSYAWVVPGRNGLCLAVPASDGAYISIGCGSLAEVSNGILQVQRPSTGPVVYGLVPSGDSVTATAKDGSQRAIPVTGNFFSYGGSGQSVTIHDSTGSAVQMAMLVTPQ